MGHYTKMDAKIVIISLALCSSALAIVPPENTYLKATGGSWTTQQSVTVYTGNWGNWGSLKMCPQNYYVCGLQTRFEPNQGAFVDDTALNGMKMSCCFSGNNNTRTVTTVDNGYYGDWNNMTYCNNQTYVCGIAVRNEPQGQVDETALNGITAQCCSKTNWDTTNNHVIEEGIWGSWITPPTTCPKNMFACGFEWQSQEPQGSFGDDTAANGIKMQ